LIEFGNGEHNKAYLVVKHKVEALHISIIISNEIVLILDHDQNMGGETRK